jgi:hypothetical protein
MRGLLAIPVLVVLGGASAMAEGPSGSAEQTMTVSVEVVRPCAIDSKSGSATVSCGQPFASQQTSRPSDAPAPLVTGSAQSADSTVTVQF